MANSDKLNAEMYKMINQFNKQREGGFICDTECQNNQNIRDLQHKVIQKENTLDNASGELLDTQRQLASYDSSYRPTFDTNMNNMADQEIDELQNQFDTVYDNIIQNLDYYDTQIAFENSLNNINDIQQSKLDSISKTVENNKGQVAVNRRKATFYSKEGDTITYTISYLQIIYWTLFGIQLIAAIMISMEKKVVLTIILLAIFPLYNTLYPILQKIFKILSLFPTP
uniref:Uncharacterized protein n=1 Tax=viral metagenome TaxID=1070528 RepID=A0A6C0C3U8_9ZZZZ